jgi:hypothetical protein
VTLFNLHVLDALPGGQAVHSETVYIVRGTTRPHVIACDGEAYPLMLEARSQPLA